MITEIHEGLFSEYLLNVIRRQDMSLLGDEDETLENVMYIDFET